MKIAYCVQYGTRPEWVRELRGPERDVFELCWSPEPVKGAIHFPKSTWTQGRNRLAHSIREAESRSGERYDYIVMSDDDITFDGLSHAEGMACFEAAIEKYWPAVAVPNYDWHFFGQRYVDKSSEVQGIYAIDCVLQAIHRDAWWVLLPYWTEFDSQSWWNSGHIQGRVAGATYKGAVVSVNTVFVRNGRSSDYPRDGRCVAADAMLAEMALPSTVWHRHETKESFLPQELDLRSDYRISSNELAKHWNLNHRFWNSRSPEWSDTVHRAAA